MKQAFCGIVAACSILIFVSAGLGGCQSIGEKRQQTRLEKALHAYELTLRWGDLRNIDSFAMAYQGRMPAGVENAERVRIISYEVLSGPAAIDDVTAAQVVAIQYIVRDTQVQKKVIDRQLWHYLPEEKTWKRISDAPVFAL